MSFLKTLKQKTYRLIKGKLHFENAEQYWEERYRRGYDSGAGSYGELAQWKAKIINTFIAANNIQNIIDFGCGDGNIADLIQVPPAHVNIPMTVRGFAVMDGAAPNFSAE